MYFLEFREALCARSVTLPFKLPADEIFLFVAKKLSFYSTRSLFMKGRLHSIWL